MARMKPKPAEIRFSWIAALLSAAVLLSGCPAQDPANCLCPNLEVAAASIDWIGDGTVPSDVTTSAGPVSLPREATVYYASAEHIALQRSVADRLVDIPGSTVQVESESGVIVAGTDWSISVQSASVSDVPALQIMVHIIDDDERRRRSWPRN
jgi:hypothetical protein